VRHFNRNIVDAALENEDFRRVVATGDHSQIVLMAIEPNSEIGEEVHGHVDQVLVFVGGEGRAVIEGETMPVEPGHLTYVPAGTRHNFINTGDEPLKLYTIYAPPEHPPGTVHRTKAEADAAEAEEHGS
jgi:mannose-6-phosphate isomerase-like protein (cupin superfamily)